MPCSALSPAASFPPYPGGNGGTCRKGAKSKVPWRKWPEEKCLNREAGGASAAAGGYLQAVIHGSHLPGGAAFPLGFHLFLLAASERKGQKGFVKTPQNVDVPCSRTTSPCHCGDKKALGRQVLHAHLGWPRSVLVRGEGCPSSTERLCPPSLHLTAGSALPTPPPSPYKAADGRDTQIHATGVNKPVPFTEALRWDSRCQHPLGPSGWPVPSRGPPVPLPCSKHLTLGLKAFSAGTCTPSGSWLPGWPADHRALRHVCFGQSFPPASSGARQGSRVLPSFSCHQINGACKTSGWSRVQPGLRSWQSQQTPGSCREVGVGFGDPPQCLVLSQIHPGRAIRVTPPFCCSENHKSCRVFFSWVMLQGVSLLRTAAPGIRVGSRAPSAGRGELSLPLPGSQGGRRQLRQMVCMGLMSIWTQQAGEISNQHSAKMAKPHPTMMGEQRGQKGPVPLETL